MQDYRVKILIAILLVGLLTVGAYAAWFTWKTSARAQFGDSAGWPMHESVANNVTFRYPPHMEVIVPEEEYKNPVSLVLPGESGETALMQIGTWRAEPPNESLEAAAERFASAASRRGTISAREEISIDGHEGVFFVLDEANGRQVLEVLLWDTVTSTLTPDPSQALDGEAREISLQLSVHATERERSLYGEAFRELVSTVAFLRNEPATGRPEGIPGVWQQFESTIGGFAVWYPPEWDVAESTTEDNGTDFVFRPTRQDIEATTFTIHAEPADRFYTPGALDPVFAQPFRESALEGTLSEERLGFPGVGGGISLEARIPVSDEDKEGLPAEGLSEEGRLEYFLVLRAGADTPEEGRVYVITTVFTGSKAQKTHIEQVRAITTTFRVLNP